VGPRAGLDVCEKSRPHRHQKNKFLNLRSLHTDYHNFSPQVPLLLTSFMVTYEHYSLDLSWFGCINRWLVVSCSRYSH
jgi:hypothetical protein